MCIIASPMDALMINIVSKTEIDLDHVFGIGDIKKVIFDDDQFYILCNKRDNKFGYFLLKLPEYNPNHLAEDPVEKEKLFFINWQNRLNIADADIYVIEINGRRQLIVSYKTIYINIYNVFIIDIETGLLEFRHESFCLWESSVMSFLNPNTLDYITLSPEGMSIMALSQKFQSKHVRDLQKQRHLIHSLGSCNYLKLDAQNHILFECSQGTRIINI